MATLILLWTGIENKSRAEHAITILEGRKLYQATSPTQTQQGTSEDMPYSISSLTIKNAVA